MRPFPDEPLEIYRVKKLVNSPRNDRPELIAPDDTAPIAEREQRLRALIEGGREMRASDLAAALQMDYDQLTELVRDMPDVELERGACSLTKWKR